MASECHPRMDGCRLLQFAPRTCGLLAASSMAMGVRAPSPMAPSVCAKQLSKKRPRTYEPAEGWPHDVSLVSLTPAASSLPVTKRPMTHAVLGRKRRTPSPWFVRLLRALFPVPLWVTGVVLHDAPPSGKRRRLVSGLVLLGLGRLVVVSPFPGAPNVVCVVRVRVLRACCVACVCRRVPGSLFTP